MTRRQSKRAVHLARSDASARLVRCTRLLAALAGAAAGSGCAVGTDEVDVVVELEHEPAHGLSFDEYIAQAKLGPDGVYTVERDLQFENLEALRAHYQESRAADRSKLVVFQRLSDGFEPTFSAATKLRLTYCVSNSFANKSTVLSQMASAIASWEAVANLRFEYLPSQDGACNENNTNVQFAVMPSLHPQYSGCAANKLMWGNGAGCQTFFFAPLLRGVLLLNYGVGIGPGETRTGVIRHELGHLLGFRHEHPWDSPQACEEERVYPEYDLGGRPLTDYDVASVMHYQECDGLAGTDMTISERDGQGARSVYGMPAAWHVPVMLTH